MNNTINHYDTGKVMSLGGLGPKDAHIKVSYIQTNTNKELSVIFSACDIRLGDEIEFIHDGNNKAIVQRNITQGKTLKDDYNILLPHEELLNESSASIDNWKKLKYHEKRASEKWKKDLYEIYIKAIQTGLPQTKTLRDPLYSYNMNPELYIENARNIVFFYHAFSAKQLILEEYNYDSKNFSLSYFYNILEEYYHTFIDYFVGVPIKLQSFEEFEEQLASTKAEIGL